MSEQEFYESLKVGDKVYHSGGVFTREEILEVKRLTRTQIITEAGAFRKKDGFRVGSDTWHRSWIYELTPERMGRIKAQELRVKARQLRDSLPIPDDDKLESYIKALEAAHEICKG